MLDPVEFGKTMAVIVREATEPLLARIKALEERQLPNPIKGDKGDDGRSVTIEDIAPLIDAAVAKAVDAIPKPKDGVDGLNGHDAEPIDVADVVTELLARDEYSAIAKLRAAEAVAQYFAEHPVKDGKNGDNGSDATDAQVERAVASFLKANPPAKGADGIDGIGMAGAMIDRDGVLIITTTKGDPIRLGCVVGKDGNPGKDGADLSDVSLSYDGHRTVTVKAKGGEVVGIYKLGVPLDRGYYRDGMECEKGDIVSHGGNAWIALRDTKAKPCSENKEDWRLFARKGRDGNDGQNGRNLGPEPPVKLNAAA